MPEMMKTCTRCQAEKPFSDFPQQFGRPRSPCKACQALASAEWRKKNPELAKESVKKSRLKNPEKAKASFKAWREENYDYKLEYNRKWAAENRGRINSYLMAWRAANPERAKAISDAWREANPEKVRARTRVRVRAYKLANPHKIRAADSRRRAQKLRATPAWAIPQKIAEFYFAADFLGMVTGRWHHVDHIVPLQGKLVCGLHCETNLQVLLDKDNLSKGNRTWPDMP